MSAGPTVATRVLVAGVGNVFLSDDGFGSEVARRLLAGGDMPPEVDVVDVGIRGMHLAYQVLEGYRTLLIIDTMRNDSPPGSLSLVEHDLAAASGEAAFDPHGMEPDAVLDLIGALARGIGDRAGDGRGDLERVLVLGATPAELSEGMGLSAPMATAVDEAVVAVHRVVARLIENQPFEIRETTDDQGDPHHRGAGGRGLDGEGEHPGHQALPAPAEHVAAPAPSIRG